MTSSDDRPGHISHASSNAVIFACAVTVLVAAFGGYFIWEHPGDDQMPTWAPVAFPLFAIGWISITALPRWELARLLRVAVLLPLAHLVVMVGAWIAWQKVHPHIFGFDDDPTMFDLLPITAVVGGAALVYGVLAWSIARGRRGEPVHAFVMLALATFLLVGLWLPIASMFVWSRWALYVAQGRVIAMVLGPPLALATLFTAIAFRSPALHERFRWLFGLVVFALFTAALMLRMSADDSSYLLFGSMVHVVLGLAFVAVASLVVLGLATWLRGRRAAAAFRTATLTGTIAADGDGTEIGCFEIASWLRGPRPMLRPFTVTTPTGAMMIHGGAQLVVPLPAATTLLEVGDTFVDMRAGDTVVIAGLEAATGDTPYRSPTTAIGGGGVVVGRPGQRYGFAHVALTVWRPCVAYLVIVLVVGLPGLLAAGMFH